MIELRALAGPTGRLLREMLEQRGLLSGPVKAVVNYGHGAACALPTLNKHAGCVNKYEELVKLHAFEVPTVPFSKCPQDLVAPIFGRKFHHTRGTDIVVGGHGSDYYTHVVPKDQEVRVWAFRGRVLAAYEKVLTYPERLGRRNRNKDVWNWANGYAYKFIEPGLVSDGLKRVASKAIEALNLDFGASDIIIDPAHNYFVLEVNTAPGTQGEARQGVTSLVNCIERWAGNGFKERRA